jgi:hypothetical protein
MDPDKFVDAIRVSVMDSAVDAVVASLTTPAGRRPAPELVELSQWYLKLEGADQEMLQRALAQASHAAVFGLFAVLDGARRIDDEQPPCEFQLWYQGREGRRLLSGDLHDSLNSKSWYR